MTDGADVVALVTQADRDTKILALRLSGLSIRRLAKEFKCRDVDILDSLERSLPPLSPETRIRLYREDLARIDDLLLAFYPSAKQGSAVAAQVCLRLLERRSTMVGTDAPQKLDVHVVMQEAVEPVGGTALLIRELQRIADERKPAGLRVVEAEAVLDGGPDDDVA
jgi:hypothetical protein